MNVHRNERNGYYIYDIRKEARADNDSFIHAYIGRRINPRYSSSMYTLRLRKCAYSQKYTNPIDQVFRRGRVPAFVLTASLYDVVCRSRIEVDFSRYIYVAASKGL